MRNERRHFKIKQELQDVTFLYSQRNNSKLQDLPISSLSVNLGAQHNDYFICSSLHLLVMTRVCGRTGGSLGTNQFACLGDLRPARRLRFGSEFLVVTRRVCGTGVGSEPPARHGCDGSCLKLGTLSRVTWHPAPSPASRSSGLARRAKKLEGTM